MKYQFTHIEIPKGKHVMRTVGKCIYCGSTEDLSEEHVVPLALNGTQVLKKASCPTHRDITSKFESLVQRNQLKQVRSALGMKTRHPDKMPKEFPLTIGNTEGSEERIFETTDFPILLFLPFFEEPGFLNQNQTVRHGINVGNVPFTAQVYGPPFDEFMQKLGQSGAQHVDFIGDIFPADFARLIAKIGYCLAVGLWGLEGFSEVYCLSSIVGKTEDIGQWVGMVKPDDELLGRHGRKNEHEFEWHRFSVNIDKENNITSRIRLFSFANTPEYIAILGKASEVALAGTVKR